MTTLFRHRDSRPSDHAATRREGGRHDRPTRTTRQVAAVVGFAGCYAFLGWHLLTDWLPRGHASASAALVAAYVASPCLMLAARRDSRRWHRALAYALSAVATVLLGLALTRVELPS